MDPIIVPFTGLDRIPCNYFWNYLTKRAEAVVADEVKTPFQSVPQDYILGPLPFCLYIKYVAMDLENCQLLCMQIILVSTPHPHGSFLFTNSNPKTTKDLSSFHSPTLFVSNWCEEPCFSANVLHVWLWQFLSFGIVCIGDCSIQEK